jgi:4-hydroxy-tetrahydrodipicolinate reductase
MSPQRVLNLVIIGVTGRMGRAIVRAASELPDKLAITGAVASTTSESLGRDAGELAGIGRIEVPVTDDLAVALARANVVVDFSQPHATHSNVAVCRAARKPMLIGTTGFSSDLTAVFDAASGEIPLLVAPNTSIGVTLLTELTRIAAQALPPDFDIEIVEAHHRMKKDAPSGTALALGKAAAYGRGMPDSMVMQAAGLAAGAALGRRGTTPTEWHAAAGGRSAAGERAAAEGRAAAEEHAASGGCTPAERGPAAAGRDQLPNRSGERRQGDLGFAVIRGGDIVGDHTVLFAGTGEQVSLAHRATDRAVFARGAVRAALWLASQSPGRYFMRDFMGLKTGA